MYRVGKEEVEAVARVVAAKQFFKINDDLQETMHAEEEIREKFGVDYALLMTSGHAALTSALISMGIGPGDEVIVPAYTYIATAMAVVCAGAMPVIAEVDDTLTLCPVDTEKKITPHTKAIMPVHIQGFPCKMDAFVELAKKYNLFIIEDACQADGGAYKGRRLGTIGNAGALSFNGFKVISNGEGGALLTNDRSVFEKSLIYHDSSAVAFFGNQLSDVDTNVFCGTEYRANEISSAILRAQVQRLDGILADLRKNKKYIMDAVAPLCNLLPSNDIEGDCGTTLAIVFDSAEKADAFSKADGIGGTVPINTGKHVYCNWTPIMNKVGALNPLMDPFKMEANRDIVPDYKADMCPETLDLLSRVVYIPMDPDHTPEQLDTIIDSIKKALA